MKSPLPTISGVAPSVCWLPEGNWATILDFLVNQFPGINRNAWITRLQNGNVVSEHGDIFTPTTPYQSHIRIFYYRHLEHEQRIPFDERILFQNDHLLVVDKPPFLPVAPTGRFLQETLLVRLKNKLGIVTLTPIHRLDRATSGVMLFSTNEATRGLYQTLFQKRAVTKQYEALAPTTSCIEFPLTYKSRLVKGEPFFRMKEIAGEPNSETHINIKKISGDLAHYLLTPITGKQHQLRVHLSSLGIPILNDIFYPIVQPEQPDDYSKPLKLLAKSIAFKDPITHADRYFESEQELLPI